LARVTTKQQAIENRNKQIQPALKKTRPQNKLSILQDRYQKYKQTGHNKKQPLEMIEEDEEENQSESDEINIPVPPEQNTPSAQDLALVVDNQDPTNKITVIKSQNNFNGLNRPPPSKYKGIASILQESKQAAGEVSTESVEEVVEVVQEVVEVVQEENAVEVIPLPKPIKKCAKRKPIKKKEESLFGNLMDRYN
jgi:hypothetical protein